MTHRLVRVVWEDASVVDDSTWVDRSTAQEPSPVVFDQVGWLLELTSEHAILTSSISPGLMAARDRIPAGMIRSIYEYTPTSGRAIRVPRKRKKAA